MRLNEFIDATREGREQGPFRRLQGMFLNLGDAAQIQAAGFLIRLESHLACDLGQFSGRAPPHAIHLP